MNGLDSFWLGLRASFSVFSPVMFLLYAVIIVVVFLRIRASKKKYKAERANVEELSEGVPMEPSLEREAKELDRSLRENGRLGKMALSLGFSAAFIFFLAALLVTALGMNVRIGRWLLAAVPVIIVLAIIIRTRHLGKAMYKRFYTAMLPGLLEGVFREYDPQLWHPPEQGMFTPKLNFLRGRTATFGMLSHETQSYRAEGLFRIGVATEGEDYAHSHYVIAQTLILDIARKQDRPLNCKILVGKDVADEPLGTKITAGAIKGLINTLDQVTRYSEKVKDPERLMPVDLENAEFERYFEVTSNDQIASRIFLTPLQMQRMLDLRNLVGNYEVYYTDEKTTVLFRHFPMIDTEGSEQSGFPSMLRLDTVRLCRKRLNDIFNNLTLLWEE